MKSKWLIIVAILIVILAIVYIRLISVIDNRGMAPIENQVQATPTETLQMEIPNDNEKLGRCANCPVYSPFPPNACPFGMESGEQVIDSVNNCYCDGPPVCAEE